MPDLPAIFDSRLEFAPGVEAEAFLKQLPGRWAVYLFADQADQPVQLLCVKNLRASVKRRLFGDEPIGPSKRVNYRDIVRRIYWQRVDSSFEADWVYLEAARQLFPQSYRGMTGFRPAWFIHVNADAAFPRYTRTMDPTTKTGLLIGPVEDKHAAARVIELVEDTFDLCRYFNILVAAPHGKACAYKEMGKCPAPCDGSIGIDRYRETIRESAAAIVDPRPFIARENSRMKEAAAALQFELAARIKAKIDQAARFAAGAFRHARLLADLQYLCLQRGPAANSGKLFLITPGWIEPIACFIDDPQTPADLLRQVLSAAAERAGSPMTDEGAERIAIVAHHLFSPKHSQGIFLPLCSIDEQAVIKAWRELRKQKSPEESDQEGIVRELQAM